MFILPSDDIKGFKESVMYSCWPVAIKPAKSKDRSPLVGRFKKKYPKHANLTKHVLSSQHVRFS